MAAKRVDPLKAKEAKQKKIAIGGVVVLLALLGIQGPKTLKMLKGPQPVEPVAASTTPASAPPAPGAPTPAGSIDGGTAAADALPVVVPDLASAADSDPAPTVEAGQLATFERFASKDPFAQQAGQVEVPQQAATPAAAGTAKDQAAAAAAGGAKSSGATASADKGTTVASTTGFTTGGSPTIGATTTGGATPPAVAPAAAKTSIAVNRVPEDVKLEQEFPVSEPTFVLVSVAKDGKSVEIGIAGGEYAGGGKTLKLKFGKRVTLQNTADGSSYELELLTIEGFPPPKK